jgi:hypothetical protein
VMFMHLSRREMIRRKFDRGLHRVISAVISCVSEVNKRRSVNSCVLEKVSFIGEVRHLILNFVDFTQMLGIQHADVLVVFVEVQGFFSVALVQDFFV